MSQFHRLLALIASLFIASACPAQEVLIPDPGLNAAVRAALQKPNGPLTQDDLLLLTSLDASHRHVSDTTGLEAARNLAHLDLQFNDLTRFTVPAALTNLTSLYLAENVLTNLTLAEGMDRLISLDVDNNRLDRIEGLAGLTRLEFLGLGFNALHQLVLPASLTNLDTVVADGNLLTNVILSPGLHALRELHLSQNQLTAFELPVGTTNLAVLNLFFNQLTNLVLPADLSSLNWLDLDSNRLTRLGLTSNLTRLASLHLRSNQLTNVVLPSELPALRYLDLGENLLQSLELPTAMPRLETLRLSGNTNLTSLVLPPGLTNLTGVFLRFSGLTRLDLPSDLSQLVQLDVLGNQLPSLALPAGLTNLATLVFAGNELTELTLPPDMTRLSTLVVNDNPLARFIVSEPLAATSLAPIVATLRAQGVSVLTYPLAVSLLQPRTIGGTFQFTVTGPPGVYALLRSPDLADWGVSALLTNRLGTLPHIEATVAGIPRRFYQALRTVPPSDMVFIPPNTFTMGSPANEKDRNPNEGPQTTVTLTRGFWIGKHEVTQGEYLSVTGTNPSQFPGDLNRPISSVSWPDATNYCGLLTQRELAAGRIPAGSRYRLPTEAEWECAARAGTTTRFSYGDDPDYSGLDNYALHSFNNGLMVDPVGQRLPNPWGLYDIHGNVWEWCQDWLGPLPGGAVSDPIGPETNPIGWKIVRGGGFDFSAADCRSARRFFFGNHPALTDWNLGFRVVFVIEAP